MYGGLNHFTVDGFLEFLLPASVPRTPFTNRGALSDPESLRELDRFIDRNLQRGFAPDEELPNR